MRTKVEPLLFTLEWLLQFLFQPTVCPESILTDVIDASSVACHLSSPHSIPHMVSSYLSQSPDIIRLLPCTPVFGGSPELAR